ncbi:MAG TPA: right-handed parallel beta-helix repeat-containing protein [Trebonia sp.]|nr:right-handed parallel beta-helix repeat-containing protein [Trebonia sp.]
MRYAFSGSRGLYWAAGAACLAIIAAIAGLVVAGSNPQASNPPAPNPPATASTPGPSAKAPVTTTRVCGQAVLRSPYGFDGAPGPYSSGTAGLPTYGTPGSDFPADTAGVVLPTGTNNYASYQLKPDTVYYLLPGTHSGGFQADSNDSFVGGFAHGTVSVLNGNYGSGATAIDSDVSNGDQPGVTIEYLTIEKYSPQVNAGAINQEANTGWTIQYNTVTLNVPGAGIIAGAGNTLKDNCLTLNGQYGFQSTDTNGFGRDSITGGPYDVTVKGNEISYNDTCDLSGLMDNKAIGWSNYNPVPARYRNSQCGQVTPDGDQGGFKLWQTNGVTIADNYIHNNWGPGGWADTDNANTTWTGNTFIANENAAIIEEISYNFSITDNYMADNDWTDGLGNSGFPQPAVYISESGSDASSGDVPACPEAACSGQRSYPGQSVISHNTLIDNGGSVFLWQSSGRFCSDGSDPACTLAGNGQGPFTMSSCKANLPTASVSTTTFTGETTGSPQEDWWDGCIWHTENVSITRNIIDFNPANIPNCTAAAWPACGAGGIFSDYGAPNGNVPGWAIPTQLTFFQHDVWADNTYNGPSTFFAWNQGNEVSWADWSGQLSAGDKCTSSGERQGGTCTGPYGQDTGSVYHSTPLQGS